MRATIICHAALHDARTRGARAGNGDLAFLRGARGTPSISSPQSTGPTGVAIVDFSASWCPPCKLIAPIYEKLALDYPDIAFYKIDIDGENVRQTVADNDVSAVPTFVSFRGGKPVGQFSGADRTALQLMVDALSSAAA